MNSYRAVVMMDTKDIKPQYLNGFYNELSTLIGIDNVLKIHNAYRGTQVSLPVELFSKKFIVSCIVSEFSGNNVKQLATKFGYSEKWIREILKRNIDESK